jgi:hypothetical protein
MESQFYIHLKDEAIEVEFPIAYFSGVPVVHASVNPVPVVASA